MHVTKQHRLEQHMSGAIFPTCSKWCAITPLQLRSPFFFHFLHSMLTEEKTYPEQSYRKRKHKCFNFSKNSLLAQGKTLDFHSAPLIYNVDKSVTNMELSKQLLANHTAVSHLNVVVLFRLYLIISCFSN